MIAALGIAPTVESEVEEHKESWHDSGLEALAAFANTRGGMLWIGLKDDGNPADPNTADLTRVLRAKPKRS